VNDAPVVVAFDQLPAGARDGVAQVCVIVQFEDQAGGLRGIVVDEDVGAVGGGQAFESDAGGDAGKAKSEVIEDFVLDAGAGADGADATEYLAGGIGNMGNAACDLDAWMREEFFGERRRADADYAEADIALTADGGQNVAKEVQARVLIESERHVADEGDDVARCCWLKRKLIEVDADGDDGHAGDVEAEESAIPFGMEPGSGEVEGRRFLIMQEPVELRAVEPLPESGPPLDLGHGLIGHGNGIGHEEDGRPFGLRRGNVLSGANEVGEHGVMPGQQGIDFSAEFRRPVIGDLQRRAAGQGG
jgi:hypothetical protein